MTERGTFDTFAIERVVYGEPAAPAVAAEVERIGAQRVFLLASATLHRETGLVDELLAALGPRSAGHYEGMPPHTPREAVVEAAAAARAARADLIVTFGGGSLTDAGKMVQLCLAEGVETPGELDRFVARTRPDGSEAPVALGAPAVRQLTVPTTLSGGEFGSGAGCTDTARRLKQLYRHRLYVPRSVVLDPAVTVHTPAWLWLSTGVRAVDHAVETLCSSRATARSDGPAIHALRLLGRGLRRSAADPGDLAARLDCQLGVWASMDHNQDKVPMGASHGIGHVLGGTCGVPHGHTSCVMLPNVLRWNREVNAERQALVSEALGRPGEDAADVVGELVSALGLPRTLAEVGVGPERFDEVARNAMHDRYIYTNPRKIAGPEDVRAILELAR